MIFYVALYMREGEAWTSAGIRTFASLWEAQDAAARLRVSYGRVELYGAVGRERCVRRLIRPKRPGARGPARAVQRSASRHSP